MIDVEKVDCGVVVVAVSARVCWSRVARKASWSRDVVAMAVAVFEWQEERVCSVLNTHAYGRHC